MKKPLIIVNDFFSKFWPNQAKKESSAPEVNLQNLEERVLYDASPLGVLCPDVMEPQDIEMSLDATMEQIDELSVAYDGIEESDDQFLVETDTLSFAEDLNLIVIDSRLDDYDQLITDLQESNVNYEILELDETTNGIEEITRRLNSGQSYAALHIIGHGEEANVQLGSVELGSDNIDQYESQISSWRAGLTGDADILLYGCDVAGSQEGIDFVDRFNELTGADIAASSDLTGNADLGGNWEFEYSVGDIEAGVVFSAEAQANYLGVFATIEVTTTTDTVDGGNTSSFAALLATPGSDGISLREAIIAANGTTDARIELNAGIYVLELATPTTAEELVTGDLDIRSDVEIVGGINGGTTVVDASGLIGERVFDVISGNTTFQNLTITGGNQGNSSGGGGIRVNGNAVVVVDNVVVTDNMAEGHGGGIENNGNLTVMNSTISMNDSGQQLRDGGGISQNTSGSVSIASSVGFDLRVIDSTIHMNTAFDDGGGISVGNGVLDLDRVTVSFNTAADSGGGIFVLNDDGHEFTNVTLSGNSAEEGGGVFVGNGPEVTLTNVTISANTATNRGGGLFSAATNTQVAPDVNDSIIAGNEINDGNNPPVEDNVHGMFVNANSRIGTTSGVLLDPLADNGGPVQTHALLPGSRGIDEGATVVPGTTTDARGFIVNDTRRDLGAFELSATSNQPQNNAPSNQPQNNAPVVDLDSTTAGLDFSTTFQAGGPAVSIVNAASISDIDSTIQTLTVRIFGRQSINEFIDASGPSIPGISTNPFPGNVFDVPSSSFINVFTFFDDGTATNADFQTLLDSLEFRIADSGATGVRMLEVVASDGVQDSLIATTTVNIVANIAPDSFDSTANGDCLLYTSPSPRDRQKSRMPSSA